MEDFFANRGKTSKKQGRETEGIKLDKGAKFKVAQDDIT